MCGIVGYVGTNQAQDVLIGGLKKLEYRGYDSAGIVTQDDNTTLVRSKGKVSSLEELVKSNKSTANIGIGHTRWATHGEPSDINAHPHNVGDIYLVHNGIIENYTDLKQLLTKRGYEFKSQTDTEVLAALIDSVYQQQETKDLMHAVNDSLSLVVGAYGIAVMAKSNKDEIVVARNGSPLVIGRTDDATYIASDPSALIEHTNQVIFLSDGQVAKCTKGGVTVQDMDKNPVDAQVEELEMDIEAMQKKGFDHFLLKEIFEQPETVQSTLNGRVLKEQNILRLGGLNMSEHELQQVEHIYIVACGTASYAGLLASYYIESVTDNVAVSVEIASELRYKSFNIPSNSVALFVSQSGETADTLACLKEMKRRGVKCLGIVNAVGSTIAREVDGGVYVHVGAEISVASTKAFTSQVVAMVLMGLVIAQAKGNIDEATLTEYVNELDQLPLELEKTLKDKNDEAKQLAKQYTSYNDAFYLGRGTLYPIALEGALKLKEISYVHVEGQAAGELKHGSIALVDDTFFEVAFVAEGELYEKTISNIKEVQARGGHVIVVTNSQKEIDAENVVRLSTNLKLMAPLVFNLFSQLFAYYMAVERGNDVDQPRNLAKSVTVE